MQGNQNRHHFFFFNFQKSIWKAALMFCSPSVVGKMEVCRVPEELRVMHTFAFFTVEPFNNGRYALEEFPWHKWVGSVGRGSLRWAARGTMQTAVPCLVLWLLARRGTTSCSRLSSEKGTARNVEAPKWSNSCMKDNKNKKKKLNAQKQLLLVYYKLSFLRLVLQPEHCLWRRCGLEIVEVKAVIYETRISFLLLLRKINTACPALANKVLHWGWTANEAAAPDISQGAPLKNNGWVHPYIVSSRGIPTTAP